MQRRSLQLNVDRKNCFALSCLTFEHPARTAKRTQHFTITLTLFENHTSMDKLCGKMKIFRWSVLVMGRYMLVYHTGTYIPVYHTGTYCFIFFFHFF
jgi:hypothetical protein